MSSFLLCMHAKSLQSCPPLCDPTGCSLPGSSFRGILQARILECVAIPPSGDPPNPGIEPRSFTSPALVGEFFTTGATWETLFNVCVCVCARMHISVCVCVCVCVSVAQSCSTFYNPMNCSPPGASVHKIYFPVKNSGVGSHPLLQGIFPTQGSNPGLLCLLH